MGEIPGKSAVEKGRRAGGAVEMVSWSGGAENCYAPSRSSIHSRVREGSSLLAPPALGVDPNRALAPYSSEARRVKSPTSDDRVFGKAEPDRSRRGGMREARFF